MDRLLQVGDVFRLSGPVNIVGECKHRKNAEPVADFSRLRTGASYEGEVRAHWTETKAGGWSREHETILNLRASIPADAEWRVTRTSMSGGGCAHGPHDVYPDGHNVTASRVGGDETLNFYQTGCFTGMVSPRDVVLLPRPTSCGIPMG